MIEDSEIADPDRVLAYLKRGNDYAAKQLSESALSDYSHAIKIDPRNVIAHSSRAIEVFRGGDVTEALKDFKQANALDPAKMSGMIAASVELQAIKAAADKEASAPAATPTPVATPAPAAAIPLVAPSAPVAAAPASVPTPHLVALTCGAALVAENGHCVRKTCPPNQALGWKGTCYPRVAAHSTPVPHKLAVHVPRTTGGDELAPQTAAQIAPAPSGPTAVDPFPAMRALGESLNRMQQGQ